MDQYYATKTGEVEGWTLIHQIIPEYLQHHQTSLLEKTFGNSYYKNSRGTCVVLRDFGSESHTCYMDIDLDKLTNTTISKHVLDDYYDMLDYIGMIDPEQYKPSLKIIYRV